MCGIAGIWDRQRKNEPAAVTAAAETMTNPLRHRGPDAGAIFADHKALCAFGHPSLTTATNRDRGALYV
jgi:asparagine synthetase B (glutamine-hydrolysing)